VALLADKVVQVAEYCTADVEAKHAAWVLFHLSSAYIDCLVNPEVGGPGALVLGELDHLRQLLSMAPCGPGEARGWGRRCGARAHVLDSAELMGAGYVIGFATTWSTQSVLMPPASRLLRVAELEIKSRAC
jgi:hypothetical protein